MAGGGNALNPSGGDEQVFREGPFVVKPLPVTPEPCAAAHFDDFFGGVFVRAFRPDGFAYLEGNQDSAFAD